MKTSRISPAERHATEADHHGTSGDLGASAVSCAQVDVNQGPEITHVEIDHKQNLRLVERIKDSLSGLNGVLAQLHAEEEYLQELTHRYVMKITLNVKQENATQTLDNIWSLAHGHHAH